MCFWCPSPKRSISIQSSICELQVWSEESYRWTNRLTHVSRKAAGFSVTTWAFICISVDCKSHPESCHGAAIKQIRTENNLMCSYPHVQHAASVSPRELNMKTKGDDAFRSTGSTGVTLTCVFLGWFVEELWDTASEWANQMWPCCCLLLC